MVCAILVFALRTLSTSPSKSISSSDDDELAVVQGALTKVAEVVVSLGGSIIRLLFGAPLFATGRSIIVFDVYFLAWV